MTGCFAILDGEVLSQLNLSRPIRRSTRGGKHSGRSGQKLLNRAHSSFPISTAYRACAGVVCRADSPCLRFQGTQGQPPENAGEAAKLASLICHELADLTFP